MPSCVTPVAAGLAAYLKITPAATGSKPSGQVVSWLAFAPLRSALLVTPIGVVQVALPEVASGTERLKVVEGRRPTSG